MKVLVSDKLSQQGLEIFEKAKGITLHSQPGLGKDIPKLIEALRDAEGIAIRSETNLTADILKQAPKLRVIGRAGIGVDNVDVEQASKQGIVVMNTPGGNTITTAEHAISMMCALTRSIPQATASMKDGKWEKSKFMGSELYQKTLGVIGCGNIGKIVADRAIGLKMKVVTFDPFLTEEQAQNMGVEKVSLDQLFYNADYITLHVPKNEKTSNLLNKDAFAKMKKGVYIINCARGGIINETDLLDALESGIVAGAALDVFNKEPVDPNNPLFRSDKVICTPHLGAATEEAQENVAIDVAHQIVNFLTKGTIENSVNVPSVSAEILKVLKPYLTLADKVGSLLGQLTDSPPTEINIEYSGDVTSYPVAPLTVEIVKGILAPILEDETINSVNAPSVARSRGIKIIETKSSGHEDFSTLLTVRLKLENSERVVSGTIFGKKHPRIVQVDGYYLEVVPEGKMLIINNEDKPGVVGNIGSLLSKKNINISRLQLGLSKKGREALAFYTVQGDLDSVVLQEVKKIAGILSVKSVTL